MKLAISQAMNGSVVSSVTDKFGFMHGGEEGEGTPTNHRTGDSGGGHSVHNDLEILREALSQQCSL